MERELDEWTSQSVSRFGAENISEFSQGCFHEYNDNSYFIKYTDSHEVKAFIGLCYYMRAVLGMNHNDQ